MWAARSPCAPTGETTLRARMASSGWWTALTASACRIASASSRACWWRSAWPEPPSSSLPTSRTFPEHCPLMPSVRPWSWTPSTATTGASRAVAPSLGRTCCLALTGSWMTFPAASSRPTESLQMPLHHSLGCPFHPPALTKHHPWEDGNQPA
uniref:ADP ribosylation factor like GTPase 2 n=1 Tax=Rousettus aegyptiacus TaxID=9407 RepID=A0A7J8GVV2_ROUAE|nr:ADP ribosylation factor like GTPase 2 [Rousettus aegyptiacus]